MCSLKINIASVMLGLVYGSHVDKATGLHTLTPEQLSENPRVAEIVSNAKAGPVPVSLVSSSYPFQSFYRAFEFKLIY